MKVKITDNISSLTGKVIEDARTAREKAGKVWIHVRDLPYSVFGVTGDDPDELIRVDNPLTCYGKSILQASMLESAGVPWRFELSMCPSHAVEDTIRSIGDENPLIVKAYEKFPGLFEGRELMHTTVQAKIDGQWKRMDSTIPHNVCNKIRDGQKREKCKSMDNVSAMHDCRVIGSTKFLPERIIRSWNTISKIGGWLNNKLKKGMS